MSLAAVPELIMPPESDEERVWRRFCLGHIDHLLFAIEEHNLACGGEAVVPVRLWRWYQVLAGDRGGGWVPGHLTGATLMEAALGLQENLLRHPVADPAVSRSRGRRHRRRPLSPW